MTLEKPPFTNYRIGEPEPLQEGKVFSIRLSPAEFGELVDIMHLLRISNHSTALKELAFIGKYVLTHTFRPETLRWLTDAERRVNESKLEKLKKERDKIVTEKIEKIKENVTQFDATP